MVEGLEAIARDEIQARLRSLARFRKPASSRAGVLAFDYIGELSRVLHLKTVASVFLVRHFAVPRPRALLGDEHFRALLAQIATVRRLVPVERYQTLAVSAAGADSPVMTRLIEELARQTGLAVASDEGDLLVRLRRAHYQEVGWDVLVRLTPRPLATRAWRVCNYEGALNATVAHAMALLSRPRRDDAFLNLACGSGTLLIERLACGPARQALGCDVSAEALACARANIAASGNERRIEVHDWDARSLPLADQSIDALCADLPFGHLVGSHDENVRSYPLFLKEAGRVAKPGARFVLITHEVRLMEAILSESTDWDIEQVLTVWLGGLHPRIFVLRRR